ncbi:MAG: ABC-F family ATP-binding cassette domain-containing protein [Bacteroidales bacterium]|nr:ABC-F family ATP-binding cassette domain-containing protein [Bacteroidales bacterium]
MAVYLQVENLTKSVGDRMLWEDVSFGVNEGDKIGLIAKNGTGKSTLLRILAGKESPDSGRVTFARGLRVAFLPQDVTDNHDDTRSGGERKRAAIEKLLEEEPQLLILDEPTNHLDIDTVEWLEGILRRKRIALLLVTHDRYFLDRVCSRIMEIDMGHLYSYDGNYANYLRRRSERIEALAADLAKVKNTLRKEQDWMSRQPQARAGKAKYRIDAYYDLKERSRLDLTERNVTLDVKSTYIGNKIFEAVEVNKAFGDKVVLRDFSYIFARYEKVGIIGHNGVGKSTFIKMLLGQVQPDSGHFDVGETVRFGYYSQEGLQLDPGKKVIDAITDIAEDVVVNEKMHYTPMQFLQRFLFTPADQQKYISTLSGGERCRLHLASVLMRSPNFLILDEPTNDLDIVTLGLLEDYLRDFAGCVIVVSHDRFFLDTIVDHLFVMEGDGVVRDFPGNYTEYRKFLQDKKVAESTEATPTKAVAPPKEPQKWRQEPLTPKLSYKEKKELEALTVEIDQLTAEKAALEATFASGDTTDIATRSARYEEIKQLLDTKEIRWLDLSEKE